MLKNITEKDYEIVSLFTRDYAAEYSISEMTKKLGINYSNAFKRVKELAKSKVLNLKKIATVSHVSFNMKSKEAVNLLSYVDAAEGMRICNASVGDLVEAAIHVDPLCCVGLFGSRAAGTNRKDSDWDMFIIVQNGNRREMENIRSVVPYAKDIHLLVFNEDEFHDSVLSPEETVVKHILRNKRILHNPSPFYNLAALWEKVKYAPAK